MYSFETSNKNELENFIYSTLAMYTDCVIELNNNISSIFIISSRLSDEDVLISLCAGDKSIGEVFSDNNSKYEFIRNKVLRMVKMFNNPIYVTVIPKEDIDIDIDDDIEEYDNNYNNHIEKDDQTSTKITNINDAVNLFKKYLVNDKCDSLIISFKVLTKALTYSNYFCLDIICDKVYLKNQNSSLISFIIEIPNLDVKNRYSNSKIYEFNSNIMDSLISITELFKQFVMSCFMRCYYISKEEIEINAYSNIKLI